ncbi:hypothetical protein GLAREA_05910 [Glarea lozoyensis ATCC 20868]|uniref:Uncharacterized protein n=1 Tax=Glarea lozoyensis (strain ATCC 20868 / MF5171) TaxID=1116229 RepID=S3E388_GLAL2|nr:uncharacterized protein GLAREA_05910 [Glarea lozoyensis ATCC 20868]EPE32898.1 hypothetical protein GLAREA_05910 [Glarea lozoyensis ATCC 20868]
MTCHDPIRCNACFDTIAGVPISMPVVRNIYSRQSSPDASPARPAATSAEVFSPAPPSYEEEDQNRDPAQTPLWKADILVYLAGKGLVHSQEREVFESEEQMVKYHEDRKRKAMIWFMVGKNQRRENLLDLCGRDKSAQDVWRRLCERVGGGKMIPLPEL